MSPRFTDWSIALASALAFTFGIVSLVSGLPREWFIFALHGVAGLWLLLLLWGKLRRVWKRLIYPRFWNRRTAFGSLALLFVALALVSGIVWVAGGNVYLAGFNLLNWHIMLGFVVTVAIALHMLARARGLRKRDIAGRRRLLTFSALLLGGASIWPMQQLAGRVLNLPGSKRRFTGSYESGSYTGNAFPTSSWVADAPRPIDPQAWRLSLGGAVSIPGNFSYDELMADENQDREEATLDCTGGFFSTQNWRGFRVGRLLDHSILHANARYVSFISVTSYRWSLPLEEARNALLATHIDEEPLSHEHGFPLRLVAPGHRGFEWVKWITRIEVLTASDPDQGLSIFTSSFTEEGRGLPSPQNNGKE